MKQAGTSEIENNLAELRKKRGFSAARLAEAAGITRQTVHAMEAGSYVPNTVVALKLARALEVPVEDLFRLPEETSAAKTKAEAVSLLPGSSTANAGQLVQLCRVDNRLIAMPLSPASWLLPISDGAIAKSASESKSRVDVFRDGETLQNRLLITGCDPAISLLAHHAQRAGTEIVFAHRNSSDSLELLKQGFVHVAGTHLRDDQGESNTSDVRRRFGKDPVALFTFAVWEEGLVVARGNPKSIRGVADLARPDVAIVNREMGAGSRRLLDASLSKVGIEAKQVRGYENLAAGHLPAAWQVQSGIADCCVATRAVGRALGLDFIPLVSERYDFAIRRQHVDQPAMQVVLNVLNKASFRRDLMQLGGYETRLTGQQVL